MKLLLLFMTLAISHVVFSQPGSEEISSSTQWWFEELSDLNTDADTRNILNLGVGHAIVEGSLLGTLPPGDYYIEDVLTIENGVDDILFYYRYNVLLGDGQGKELKLNVTYRENFETGEKGVISYEFVEDSGQGASPLAGFEAVDESELETNQDLIDSLNYGIEQVITALGRVPSDYYRSETYSIKRQSDDDGGMIYRFNLKLEDGQGGSVTVIFVVHSPSEGEKEVSFYFLDIDNGGDTELPDEPEDEEEEEVVVPDGTSNQLNTDSNLRDALNFAVKSAIERGIEREEFPVANYYIEDVISIMSYIGPEVNDYFFNVILADGLGNEIKLKIVLYEWAPTRWRDLSYYEFIEAESPFESWEAVDEAELETNQDLIDSLNYGFQNVITELGLLPEDYHLSETYSIKRQSDDDDGMNYRFNIELQNDQGGNIHVIFVVHSPSEGEKAVTSILFLEVKEEATSVPEEETSEEESN